MNKQIALHLREQSRRAYWTAKMDDADAFMQRIAVYPVQECGEPMVSLVEAVRSANVEAAFSTVAHVHGLPRLFYLREGLIGQFLDAARDMNDHGWVLKVEDAYRSYEMQRDQGLQTHIFQAILRRVQWECHCEQPPVDLLCRRYAALIANAPKVGTHMSGSAIDISVLQKGSDREVDRGKPYLEMSECTPMDSPYITMPAQQNRVEITALMRRHGFSTYPWEFWHYNDGDAYAHMLNNTGQSARYGPVHMDISNGSVRPIDDPTALLVSPDIIREKMRLLLKGDIENPNP